MAEEGKRLQFLTAILANTGTSKRELARLMGVSPQNIFVYFQRDDMKLSYAQRIFEKLGYYLIFTLDSPEKSSRRVLTSLDGIIGDNHLQRLAFLQIAMKLGGIGRRDLAEKLGLNYMGINRWFQVDDIAISYLFKIAELYNLKVSIRAEKIVRPEPDTLNLL